LPLERKARVECNLHWNTLRDLSEITGGVIGRQGELRAAGRQMLSTRPKITTPGKVSIVISANQPQTQAESNISKSRAMRQAR
jgi:hypothetical protein